MNKIKQIRKELGMGQVEFALAIGAKQPSISYYENGLHQIMPDVAGRLIAFAGSKGIKVTFDDIYQGDA